VQLLKGHDLTPTCVALSGDTRAVSGSKDHSVLLWDLEKQCRVATVCEHWKKDASSSDRKNFRTMGEVLAVACSDDGRYAAVGRRDAKVQIFDIRAKAKYNLVQTFEGHKGAVTCLAFQSYTNDLFAGSEDRCIRHYNLNEMMYLETLYGHQFGVSAIDCLAKERPISVGKDRTARAWKLAEDAHLIFRGGSKIQAAESISMIKEDWFLTGHQDGHLSLWLTEKKKATVTVEHAHGVDETGVGRPVVSIASLRHSDLAVSGSCDGYLRFWNAQTGERLQQRSLESAFQIPLDGYINAVAFGPKAKFCVAAVGQEHRNGRWDRVAKAKNRLAIISLRNDDLEDGDADDDQMEAETVPQVTNDDADSQRGESSDGGESDLE
jgi:ribosomal RNA-processing protein 9